MGLQKLGAPEGTARWICQGPWLRIGRPLFKHLPPQLSGEHVGPHSCDHAAGQ